MDDLTKYHDLFLKTASENLKNMDEALVEIDNENRLSFLEEFHRYCHSLKGEALTMKYLQLGNYAGIVELYLKSLIDIKKQISEEKVFLLKLAVREMNATLLNIKTVGQEPKDLAVKAASLQKQLAENV